MTDCSFSSESTTTTTATVPGTSSSPVSVLSSITDPTMKLEDIRPLKRQKQQDNATSTNNPKQILAPPTLSFKSVPQSSVLLEYISDDALTALIFSFLGAVGTSQCARVCLAWQTVSQKTQSSQLWREFVRQDFGFELGQPSKKFGAEANGFSTASSPPENNTTTLDNLKSPTSNKEEHTINSSNKQQPSPTNHIQEDSATNKNNHTNKKEIHWQQVYTYLARHHQHHQQLQSLNHQHHQLPHQNRLKDATVIFADDGGNFPGYPPSNALRPEKSRVWCTRTGVDTNVDLVIQLDQVSLITGFVAANGGRGYSAPLKEGLVFCSMDPPDLEDLKLLSSHSPPGLEDISDNIDLMHFHTLGVPLPSWNDLVPPQSSIATAIPDYQYRHERRREALLLPNHHNDHNDEDHNDDLNGNNEEDEEEDEEGDEEVFF